MEFQIGSFKYSVFTNEHKLGESIIIFKQSVVLQLFKIIFIL